MSLADPQTITINSVAKTLNRVKTEGMKSTYKTDDENYEFVVSHQETAQGRTRRMVRLNSRVIAADPLSAVNEYKSLGVYLVIDEPEYGFVDADIDYVCAGLQAWLTQANRLKVLSNQH